MKLVSKQNFIGLEGRIAKGQEFEPFNDERGRQLVENGVAVEAPGKAEEKQDAPAEVKGGKTPRKASKSKEDVETK